MFGKAKCSKTVTRYVGRDPDGMVKPALVESQCPTCKGVGTEMTVEIRCSSSPRHKSRRWSNVPMDRVAMSDLKDTNGTPKPSYTSSTHGTRDRLRVERPMVTEPP